MVSSQIQQAQRASGEKATVGRLFLLDSSRQDFLEIVRAKRNNLPLSVVDIQLDKRKGK